MKKLFFITLFMALTACATVQDNGGQETPKGVQKLYKCGFFMCTNITITADRNTRQTVKLLVDTGSAGLRIDQDSLSDKMVKKLKENTKKYGDLKTIQYFFSWQTEGIYTTANVSFMGEIQKDFGIQVYKESFMKRLFWRFICECDGLLGIRTAFPIDHDKILYTKNINKNMINNQKGTTKEQQYRNFLIYHKPISIIEKPFYIVNMKSVLYGKSYTIVLHKNSEFIKAGVAKPEYEAKNKKWATLVDTGSPFPFKLRVYDETVKVIGINKLYGHTLYCYLNGTMISDTMYFEGPKTYNVKDKK